MRYGPGSIELNDRDIRLLRTVFRAEVVSHDQLFELTQLIELPERSRKTFNWRVARLTAHGLFRKETLPMTGSSWVYSISRCGFEILVNQGEISSIAAEQFDNWQELQRSRRYHALGLNNIHIALRKSRALLDWIPATAVQAANELTSLGYGKDYDAVVFLRKGEVGLNLALEYERTRKTAEKYREILAAFESDYKVAQLLYVVAHDHLRSFLRACFAHAKRRIILVLERDLRSLVLQSPAEQVGRTSKREPLIDLLSRTI